jgi:hypothetical protein
MAEPEPLVATEAEPMTATDPEPAVATVPRADWEPAMLTPAAMMARSKPEPRHDPVEDAPTTTLPEGFDLSRFGRHVQAAYRGPTEDNPSLSLKHRLRRASAMDQRERMDAEARESRREEAPIERDGSFMLGSDDAEQAVDREYSRQD